MRIALSAVAICSLSGAVVWLALGRPALFAVQPNSFRSASLTAKAFFYLAAAAGGLGAAMLSSLWSRLRDPHPYALELGAPLLAVGVTSILISNMLRGTRR
jgi:hypothetical protein